MAWLSVPENISGSGCILFLWSFMSSFYRVCVWMFAHVGWAGASVKPLKCTESFLVHLHCICSGQQPPLSAFPLPFLWLWSGTALNLPLKTLAHCSFYLKETLGRCFETCKCKSILWNNLVAACIWRRPLHLEKALLPGFVVLGSCPACCFYKGIMERDL